MAGRMLLAGLVLFCGQLTAEPASPGATDRLVTQQAGFWRSCEKSSDTLASRDLFAYAFLLGEARQHPERLDRLFTLAEAMQDHDPQSRSYGNFWWARRDGRVMDANAVDFCMRSGTLFWRKDRDFAPAAARSRLERILRLAIQGCLRQHVPPSYSNIAIMNAGDLILLGEELDQPAAVDEGYARLDRVFHYTRTAGIHEFDSPTYTGVDLDGLGMILNYCQRHTGRIQAQALLKLWWTDIALNWFPPAQKLAGAQSRTYDYLHGLGGLDQNLGLNGWLAATPAAGIDTLFSRETNWQPPADLADRARHFPRLVREIWGTNDWDARTHYLLPDITLSSTAASYGGRMDMPLTVDLPGPRDSVRGYFIADGRNDPYGKIKIPAGAHQKTFHLNPFWTAAQRTTDALGLAIYRDTDVPAIASVGSGDKLSPPRGGDSLSPQLTSDFVMPLVVDSYWIGEQRVTFTPGQSVRLPVSAGEVVSLRQGQAVLGLRVPWSRGRDGQAAQVWLIYDGNIFGAVRLAVEHANSESMQQAALANAPAGAAFWLRIGDGLKSDEDFYQWLRNFTAAMAEVQTTGDGIQLHVAGADGPVSVAATTPWSAPESLEPAPTHAVLELDGKDIGNEILAHGGP